jgi:ATP-dependent Lon protease
MRTLNNNLNEEKLPEILPIIPTMDVVVFPHMIVPLLVLDERIINGINQSLNGSKKVLLLASKKKIEDGLGAIGTKDLYEIGTISSIMRLIKIPEGGLKIHHKNFCNTSDSSKNKQKKSVRRLIHSALISISFFPKCMTHKK